MEGSSISKYVCLSNFLSFNRSVVQIWTKQHDILLCREVLAVNPFSARKNSNDRGRLWEVIKRNLNATPEPSFVVTKRGVRDHIGLLKKNFIKKMVKEEKQSGISPEPTELDRAVEQIIEMEESADVEQQVNDAVKKQKEASDREKAENIRKKAMEKLGDTTKRSCEGGSEKTPKKKRKSGNETVEYLREKSENEFLLRQDEMALKKEKNDIEAKKHESFLAQQAAVQTQQKEMLEKMHEQQLQFQQQSQGVQMAMLQQQQQQTQAFMVFLEKLIPKQR